MNQVKRAQEEIIAFLKQNPEKAVGPDQPATARLEEGLRCRLTGKGLDLVMDMPKELGTAAGPSPGMVLRAADSGCLAIVIAMKAAREEVKLSHLEVTVESTSDDRGLYGMGDAPAGPLSYNVKVRIAGEATEEKLREIIRWADEHSPVSDAVRRAIPSTMELTILK